MPAVFTIAAKDLRQRFRDRSAIVLGFVAPVLLAVLMNLSFGNTEEFHVILGVVVGDDGPVAAQLVDILHSEDLAQVLTIETVTGTDTARRAVDDGDLDAALVIPSGFSAAVTGNDPASLAVLTSVDRKLAGEVTHSIAADFTTRLSAVRLSVATARTIGVAPDALDQVAADALAVQPPEVAVERPSGGRPLQGIAYYGPGVGMFFVLFAIGFTARGFFRERTAGTLDRIAAAPVRPGAVLLGKALATFVYAAASLLTIAAITGTVFGASWGNPLAVVALCLGMACAVVALAALVMVAARSERQAETIGSALTFTLALLGGNFVSLGRAPETLRQLASFTPNGLALLAFTDLGTGSPAGEAVAGPLAGIALFTLVAGGMAAIAARRVLVR